MLVCQQLINRYLQIFETKGLEDAQNYVIYELFKGNPNLKSEENKSKKKK
jgi:hypothetical protein